MTIMHRLCCHASPIPHPHSYSSYTPFPHQPPPPSCRPQQHCGQAVEHQLCHVLPLSLDADVHAASARHELELQQHLEQGRWEGGKKLRCG